MTLSRSLGRGLSFKKQKVGWGKWSIWTGSMLDIYLGVLFSVQYSDYTIPPQETTRQSLCNGEASVVPRAVLESDIHPFTLDTCPGGRYEALRK